GVPEAPGVLALPENLDLEVLPPGGPGAVVIGLDDFNLAPASVPSSGALMVTGPPGSGRTTALVTLAEGLKKSSP
ncbi:hypothetical protein LXJ57_25325, partial [Escherichia coli]|nr:hypothetical protein [Escherichia coli]